MEPQIVKLLVLGLAFLALFLLCEWLYHRRGWQAEHTRKLAHAGSGVLSLVFPLVLENFWVVALLCGVFLSILVVTKYTGMLRSIHGIPRVSYGSTMFPFVVCLCFWRFEQTQQLIQYYLPVLIMALADPAACLIGKRLPLMKLFRKKTLGGSLAFFLVAVALTLVMGVLTPIGETINATLWRAFTVGMATTIAEALSGRGFDNLTIPLAALAVI